MNLHEFEDSTAFERYALARAVPLLQTSARPSSVDLRGNISRITLTAHTYIGRSPDEPVDVELRPLFFGAAWKVLDLLLEFSLELAGRHPDLKSRWSITKKVQEASSLPPGPGPFAGNLDVWHRLCKLYTATAETRHALVHRRAEVLADGTLQGHVAPGTSPPSPISTEEQLAFCRLIQRVATAVIDGRIDERDLADIKWQCNQLKAHHFFQNISGGRQQVARTVLVIGELQAISGGEYEVDLRELKSRAALVFQQERFFDLHLSVPDRPEIVLVGRLDEAPDIIARIDIRRLPAWLSRG